MAAVPEHGRANGSVAPVSPEALHAARLYERYAPRVFGLCLARLGNRSEAEDAVQTTFLQALASLRRGTRPVAEAGWLLKIAQNVCIARWRERGRRLAAEVPREPRLLEQLAQSRDGDELEPQRLTEAVASLPEQQRRAILLREWQGLSYREVADELGVSVAAVETMIFRARRRLADSLRERDTRLERGSGIGSLVAWLKSLAGGGVAAGKLAAATTVAGVLVAGGGIAIDSGRKPDRPAAAPASTAVVNAPAAKLARPTASASPTTAPAPRKSMRPSRRHAYKGGAAPVERRPDRGDATAPATGSPPASPPSSPTPVAPDKPATAIGVPTTSAPLPDTTSELPGIGLPDLPPAPTLTPPQLPSPPALPATPSVPLP